MAEKKHPRLPKIRYFVEICHGNLMDATLLRSMAHWTRYAEVERDGGTWNVNSREWWAEEVGFSIHQLKRSLTRLRVEGLIKTERHLWGTPLRIQLFTRLTAHAWEEILGEEL